MWPFRRKAEKRESFTDIFTGALESNAIGNSIARESLAIEAAAGLLGRSLADAAVNDERFTPEILMDIGRNLLRHGEVIYLIGDSELTKVSWYTLNGGHERKSWKYNITLAAPNTTYRTSNVSYKRILHIKYATGLYRPYEGTSPFRWGPDGASLAERVEQNLNQEFNARHGKVIPLPGNKKKEGATEVLKNLKGNTAAVETTAHGGGGGIVEAPRQDWMQKSLGPMPSSEMIELYKASQDAILKAAGVPLGFFAKEGQSREEMRHYFLTVVVPISRFIQAEWKHSTGMKLKMGFSILAQSDLAARARAFKGFVDSGLPIEKAAAISGIFLEE